MKWIGQHIWDFISRFRGEVYFENLASTSNTKSLVVDTDGKLSTNSSNTTDVTLAGQDYLTLSGQEITANNIDLTDDVSGVLPEANGGTGLTSTSTLLNSNTTATDVGLENVTNESKATMFTSPAFTGSATADNLDVTGTLTAEDVDITGVSNALTVNCDDGNVGIYVISTDDIATIRFEDSATNDVIIAGADGDDFFIRTDDGGFKVKTQEDATTALDLTSEGNLTIPGKFVSKQRQVFVANFVDDIGTTKHYIPWKDINEQTIRYQDESAMLMPCDGRIVSVSFRAGNLNSSSADVTIGIETGAAGVSFASTWTIEETETLTVANTDDHHVFHFAFDNAKHFESTDLVAITVQASADLYTANTFFWFTVVVEYDFNTFLGETSAEYTTTP